MAKNKETENKKLNKDDHKGVNMAAKAVKIAGAAVGAVVVAVNNKDKIAAGAKVAAKVATKVIFK